MRIKNFASLDSINQDRFDLEGRLLRFYIVMQIAWAFVNMCASIILKMPFATMMMYCLFMLGMLLVFGISKMMKKPSILTDIYFVAMVLVYPFMWYFAGGSRSSASILFVCELVLFVMCLKGRKQAIFIGISLFSSGFVQGMSQRLPNPVYPMTMEQYQKGGSVLGLTTCLLIASLLLMQKKEYVKERDAAVLSEMELERSNSLQKNFLANMSHEIRSPLGIVMGFNHLIMDSDSIENIHEYSKDIEQAGSTLLTVINDILDYSKIESGKLDIIEADYSFSDLISQINRDIGLKCNEKGLRLITEVDSNIPQNLHGDNIRLKQCLINLLSNAVKYTEKGTINFNVTSLEKTEKDIKIRFVVRDTGKGISEEALPNLFSAFQRLDEGANRGIEGTGLGLAITKNLLDEMNGTIEVQTKLGQGSSFVIDISQQFAEKIAEDEMKVSEAVSIAGKRVLVVDDTTLNLILIKRLLKKEGIDAITLESGKECLADVEQHPYDIILLDHMMPEMNGVEVFKKIKELGGLNQNTPIVMLTANAMVGAMQEYLDIGFDGYLSKPVNPEELKELIYRLVIKQ